MVQEIAQFLTKLITTSKMQIHGQEHRNQLPILTIDSETLCRRPKNIELRPTDSHLMAL